MAKTTYQVTMPNGQVFTRKTERTYAFAITAKPNFDRQLAEAEREGNYDQVNYRFICLCVSDNNFSYMGEDRIAHYKASAAMTEEEYLAACRAERVGRVMKMKEDGHYERFLIPSWASRSDLAAKEADHFRKLGHIEVTVVPAEVKPTKAGRK